MTKSLRLTKLRAYLLGILTGICLIYAAHACKDIYFRLDRLEYYVQQLANGR